jgi:hypothetical protein
MKVEFWVMTDKVRSKMTRTIDIPDEDLEDLTQAEKERLISDYFSDELWNMIEWGWVEKS